MELCEGKTIGENNGTLWRFDNINEKTSEPTILLNKFLLLRLI